MSASPEVAVSVVLPTLNRRTMVTRAVASVLAQTRCDFELIVVDCGSTDGTASALAPVLNERVRLLTVPGAGASAARNVGVQHAVGDIVAFLDSDDVWQPEHLSVVCGLLERHPEAVLASTCPRFDVAGRAPLSSAREVEPLPKLLAGSDVGWPTCVAVRRGALEEVEGFDDRLVAGGDTDLWPRLALCGRFVFLRRRTVTIQRTIGSLSDRGRERGDYFKTLELSTTRFLVEAARSGRRELEGPALGAVKWARALNALAREDEEAMIAQIREAAELLPDLSRESDRVLTTVRWHFPRALGARRRFRVFATLAGSWPDQSAETAVRLRGAGVLAGLQARKPVAALALLRGIDPCSAARLAVRLILGIPYHFRRMLNSILHRGRETAES